MTYSNAIVSNSAIVVTRYSVVSRQASQLLNDGTANILDESVDESTAIPIREYLNSIPDVAPFVARFAAIGTPNSRKLAGVSKSINDELKNLSQRRKYNITNILRNGRNNYDPTMQPLCVTKFRTQLLKNNDNVITFQEFYDIYIECYEDQTLVHTIEKYFGDMVQVSTLAIDPALVNNVSSTLALVVDPEKVIKYLATVARFLIEKDRLDSFTL